MAHPSAPPKLTQLNFRVPHPFVFEGCGSRPSLATTVPSNSLLARWSDDAEFCSHVCAAIIRYLLDTHCAERATFLSGLVLRLINAVTLQLNKNSEEGSDESEQN